MASARARRARRAVGRATIAAVACVAAGACTTDTAVPGDTATVPAGTDGTLLSPGETIPSDADVPAAVIERLVVELPGVIGVAIDDAAQTCVGDALRATLHAPELRALGLDGALLDQPLTVQGAVYAAFDGCLPAGDFARLGAPQLIAAGASEQGAECVMSTLRTELGFAGMFLYGQSLVGEADPDPALDARVKRIYRGCSVDPAMLTVAGVGATLPDVPVASSAGGPATSTTQDPATTFPPVVAPPSSVQLPPPTTTTTTAVPTTAPTTEALPK